MSDATLKFLGMGAVFAFIFVGIIGFVRLMFVFVPFVRKRRDQKQKLTGLFSSEFARHARENAQEPRVKSSIRLYLIGMVGAFVSFLVLFITIATSSGGN